MLEKNKDTLLFLENLQRYKLCQLHGFDLYLDVSQDEHPDLRLDGARAFLGRAFAYTDLMSDLQQLLREEL